MSDEKPPQSIQHWAIDAIKSLGLPTVFLCVVVYMIWAAGKWAGSEVVMPLFQRQTTFIDTATKTLTDTQLTAAELHHGQAKGFDDLKQIRETATQVNADTKRIIDMLKDVQEMILEKDAK